MKVRLCNMCQSMALHISLQVHSSRVHLNEPGSHKIIHLSLSAFTAFRGDEIRNIPSPHSCSTCSLIWCTSLYRFIPPRLIDDEGEMQHGIFGITIPWHFIPISHPVESQIAASVDRSVCNHWAFLGGLCPWRHAIARWLHTTPQPS